MDSIASLDAVKSMIIEGISIASLLLAGGALVLIEIWGIKKIWRAMNGRRRPASH